MSRIYENGYIIEYPNEIAYAGMPAIVRVSQLDSFYTGASVNIKVGENYYTEARIPHDGNVVFDISRYMQMAFDGTSIGYRLGESGAQSDGYIKTSSVPRSVMVTVVFSGTTTSGNTTTNYAKSFTVIALPGYMKIGDIDGSYSRKRKWFYHYPMTLDFYTKDAASLKVLDDTRHILKLTNIGVSDEIRGIGVDLAEYVNPNLGLKQIVEVDPAFYLTTDYTAIHPDEYLTLKQGVSRYRLEMSPCTSGIYLRWLDHFGQWCYYLFRVTGRSYGTKEMQSWQDGVLRDNMIPDRDVYIANGQAHQQMWQQEGISLGAKMVGGEEYDFLLTLTNAPIVEMLINGSDYIRDSRTTPVWERVSVVAGSYARTTANFQDFMVSITRNAQTSQML